MHIVVLEVDALRPDRIGAYGHDIDTPHIDQVADDGVVFDNAYTANSPSLPARAAFITGRYGISNGIETHGPAAYRIESPHTWAAYNRDRRDYWTLPELFFNNRTTSCAVASDGRHPAPWLYHVWHEFHQPQEPAGDRESFMTVRGETVADRCIDLLDRHDNELFLYTQFWDTHAPYKIPDSDLQVAPETVDLPPYPTQDQIDAQQPAEAWRCSRDVAAEDRDDLAALLADYDTAVRYVDRQIGRIVNRLKAEDVYDETLLVISADHGEEFGEHGVYREHWSTYDGTQRIPLIVKPPADAPHTSSRQDALVTNVDLAPTLADYTGLDAPRAWQGRSLRPLLNDNAKNWRDHVVLDHGLYTAQRAVRTQRWKLIRTYHPGTWTHLPEIQLFDLEQDPWEQDDVSADYPDVVQDLHRAMQRFVDDHISRNGDPLMAVADDGPIGAMGKETNVAAWQEGE